MTDTLRLAIGVAFVYAAIGTLNAIRAIRAVKKLLPPIIHLPRTAVFFASLIAMVTWPFDFIVLGVIYARSFWKQRKKIKHWFLGYWPIVASSANLIGHWFAQRDEICNQLDSQLFCFIDMHMQETAHYLKEKYGVDVLKDFKVTMLNTVPGMCGKGEVENLGRETEDELFRQAVKPLVEDTKPLTPEQLASLREAIRKQEGE